MKIIKNFYGFGKDGYKINGEMFESLDGRPLNEDDLNYKDLDYIKTMNGEQLFNLGKRLDRRHYQCFYKKVEFGKKSGSMRKRYFEYRGEMKTLGELSQIKGIEERTIRARVVRYGWSVEKAVEYISPNMKSLKINK